MSRLIHTWLALPSAIFIILIAVSGLVLSFDPIKDTVTAPVLNTGQSSVAILADKVQQNYQGVEQIKRTQNGLYLVSYANDQGYGEDQIDPVTGMKIQAYEKTALYNWMKSFHRSFMLGDTGRLLVAGVALILLALSVSGLCLMIRRLGGMKHIFKWAKGTPSQKIHTELSRLTLIVILTSSLTALYLSATTFSIIPESSAPELDYPVRMQMLTAEPVISLSALQSVDATQLVVLEFPYAGDLESVYSLETQSGLGYIDPTSGLWLDCQNHSNFYQISQFISALHTGEGMGLWTIFLALTSLTLPIISISGVVIWFRKKVNAAAFGKADTRSMQNFVSSQEASIVILAGSEGLSTWRFAQEFAQALIAAGNQVHLNNMNQVEATYANATHVFLMTSTYGEGQAPSSASLFLEKAKALSLPKECLVNVLGFGDSQFTHYVGFAAQVEALVKNKGFKQMLPMTAIDRFCQESLASWIDKVSRCLNQSLCLKLDKKTISPFQMQLAEQTCYGEAVGAPVRILRFKAGNTHSVLLNPALDTDLDLDALIVWPEFEVGDLVGIMPPGSDFARYYSLASCDQEGMLEICVRKQVEGECSGFLHGLKEGDAIQAFIQKKASFRPAQDANAVIMIGAGTGMAPLQGFIKQNKKQVPYYLYWGGRLQNSDFIYEDKLSEALATSRLKQLRLAFSRSAKPQYVQNLLTDDAKDLSERILGGAQIMVCGSQVMAEGVRVSLDKILKQDDISVSDLEQAGRYVQDVY